MNTVALRTDIQKVLRQFAHEGLFSGAAVGFYAPKQGISEEIYFGCPPETLFDLASLTKCLVTAPLVARAEMRGDWQASNHMLAIPEFQFLADLTNDSWKSTLANKTLESLIAHDASFPAWHNFWIGADFTHLSLDWHRRSERIREIFSRILTFRRPSDRPVYSDVGYILLGLLLETRGQESLAQQFIQLKKEFGISKDVAIGYPESLAAQNLATSLTTGYCALRRRSLVGEVHDENAYALGGVAGHAGLFSDLGSLSLYLHGLFSSRLGDFLIQRSGDLLARGNPYAYGLQPMDGEYSRDFAGGLSLGHLGFTGTGFWYDAHRSITIIQLCNRTHKKRRDDRIKPFRREILRISERYASSL